LMLHCGGRKATWKEVTGVPLPKETKSYKPVGHGKMVTTVRNIAKKELNYDYLDGMYGLSRKGQHFFGVLTFKSPEKDMGLSIGLANSYDKEMTVKLCAGSKVFVCDNLCFTGDVTYMRKHTKWVWFDLENAIKDVLDTTVNIYQKIVTDAKLLKKTKIETQDGFGVLGKLYGNRIITARQFSDSVTEWKEPRFDAFKPRTAWSLYNAVNFGLKRAQPIGIMERHVNMHKTMMDLFPAKA